MGHFLLDAAVSNAFDAAAARNLEPKLDATETGFTLFCSVCKPDGRKGGHTNATACSVKIGDNGDLVAKCLIADCEASGVDIIHALGLRLNGEPLGQEIAEAAEIETASAPVASKEPDVRRLVDTHPYPGEGDGPDFKVERYEFFNKFGERTKKEFSLFRLHKGEWLLGGGNLRPPIYHRRDVREIAKRGGGIIYLVEGEGKANALQAALDAARITNVAVTTIQGGAKAEMTPANVADFAGAAQVIVLPDNDPPGRKGATIRATALCGAGLDVRMLTLPGLTEKGDVADWLDDGGTVPELQKLVAATKPYDPFGIEWQPAVSRDGPKPPAWDVAGLVERDNGPLFITAPPETFKTWYAGMMGVAIATRKPFLGKFATNLGPARKHVFLINLDAGRQAVANRLCALTDDDVPNLGAMTWTGDWSLDRLEALLKKHPGCFVVIDCWTNIFDHGDGKVEQGQQMRQAIEPIRELLHTYGANAAIIDHTPRSTGQRDSGEAYYGSVQKKAAIRQGHTLSRSTRKSTDSTETLIDVGCLKMSEAPRFEPFTVAFKTIMGPNGRELMIARVLDTYEGAKRTTEEWAAANIVELMMGEPDRKWAFSDIENALRDSPRQLHNALKDRETFVWTRDSKAIFYSLTPAALEVPF